MGSNLRTPHLFYQATAIQDPRFLSFSLWTKRRSCQAFWCFMFAVFDVFGCILWMLSLGFNLQLEDAAVVPTKLEKPQHRLRTCVSGFMSKWLKSGWLGKWGTVWGMCSCFLQTFSQIRQIRLWHQTVSNSPVAGGLVSFRHRCPSWKVPVVGWGSKTQPSAVARKGIPERFWDSFLKHVFVCMFFCLKNFEECN